MRTEIYHLFKAWAIISLVFAIVLNRSAFLTFDAAGISIALLFSALTVGVSFLIHELAHKYMAQAYGCVAEFRSDNRMLGLALVMSFFGFVFIAPGGVMISGHITRDQNGKISMVGPLSNLILAVCFYIVGFIVSGPILTSFVTYGMIINVWLGLFNLLPFWQFDGKKILAWNKVVYGLMAVSALVLMFIANI